MTNTVLLKRSNTANAVPLAGNLTAGELALNYTDGNLFYKNSSGVVTLLASNQQMSVFGNITGGNILTSGIVSATGNITGGNILTSGIVSATGNITGKYFLGNANIQYTASSAPATGNLIGAQWYNTSTDTLYEWQTDGTSNYWVDVTGPVIGSTLNSVYASYYSTARTTSQTTGIAVGNSVIFPAGSQVAGTDITLNASTGQFTLAAGKTYRLTAMIPDYTASGGQLAACWYNETASAYIGSISASYSPTSGAAYGAMGGPSVAVITPGVSTVVSYRIVTNTGVTGLGGSADFATTGSYPWADLQVIGGQSPVTAVSTMFNGTSNVLINSPNGNITVNPTGTSNVVIWSTTGEYVTGLVSASGNITGGNILTAGIMSSTGNATHGNLATTGAVYSNYNTNTANTGSFMATGGNTKGGTGYLDFLVVQNTSGGATNPYKWFRTTSDGQLQLINSAYATNILNLTDAGAFSVPGPISVSGKQAVNGPAFSAYANNSLQTITSGSQQKVLFQTEEFDTNSNFASSRFTPTVEGYYQLNAEVRLDGASGTGEMMIVLYKNGSEYKRGTNQSGTQIASNFWAMQVSSMVYANGTGDYFEIYVQQGSGGSVTVTAVNNPAITWFNGCMLRGA